MTKLVADRAIVDVGDLRVPTGVAISGQIVDEHGNPLKGAIVSAWRLRYLSPGERRLEFEGKATSSGSGDYQIDGLRPGTYFVDAKASDTIAPTFFPSMATASTAAPITVTANTAPARVFDCSQCRSPASRARSSTRAVFRHRISM